MSQQHIGIAVRQRAAIPPQPEDMMASPYLDRVRSARALVGELISARETELQKTSATAQRHLIEQDLMFLRDELVRLDREPVLRLDATV